MATFLLIRDEEIAFERSLRRQRVFRDRESILDTVDDITLFSNYRMPRAELRKIVEITSHHLDRDTKRSHALSPETQIMTAIRFYSKGGFYSEIAGLHNISKTSVSRCISAVTDALLIELNNIDFPTDVMSQNTVKYGFYSIAKFPRVLGCIDGTLIPIIAPSLNEEAYVCRKGFHAINTQAVCDSNLRFLNVVSKWPGATHDATMWNNCQLASYFEDNHPDGWLLGDSGYACRPWLMTPILEARNQKEERYNKAHCQTRNVVERAFGVLKSRFRCLHKTTGCLPFTPSKSAKIIMACCKLHNYCVDSNVPVPELDEVEIQDPIIDVHRPAAIDGQTTRRELVELFQ